jgi:tRNA nucleotidyltransferase (CCA-adding enzyme)
MCGLLNSISAERIRTELEKLLCSKAPAEVLINYSDVFSEIIPEFKNSIGFDQHSPYHVYDVWKHIAYAVEHSKNVREVRLALFFHDIAKPACFITDDEGRGHFPKHELLGEEMTERIMRRLRFDNKTIKAVCELVKYHYVTPIDDDSVIKRLLSAIGSDQLKLLIEVLKGDSRAKEAFCLERVNVLDSMKIRMYEIISSGECWSLDTLAINGTDIAKLGVEGKYIGEVLDKLLSDVIEGDISNEKEALSARALRYKKELLNI